MSEERAAPAPVPSTGTAGVGAGPAVAVLPSAPTAVSAASAGSLPGAVGGIKVNVGNGAGGAATAAAAVPAASPSRMRNPFFHSAEIEDEGEGNVGLVLDEDESDVPPAVVATSTAAGVVSKGTPGALSIPAVGKGPVALHGTSMRASVAPKLPLSVVSHSTVATAKGGTGASAAQLLLIQQQQAQQQLQAIRSLQQRHSAQQQQQQQQQQREMQKVGSSGDVWGQFGKAVSLLATNYRRQSFRLLTLTSTLTSLHSERELPKPATAGQQQL